MFVYVLKTTRTVPGCCGVGNLAHFEKLIQKYLAEKRDTVVRLRDNHRLINTIQQIRTASLRALWTDYKNVFPERDGEIFW